MSSLKRETGGIPSFDYDSVMKKDVHLLEWLESFRKWGISLITGVPEEVGHAKVRNLLKIKSFMF